MNSKMTKPMIIDGEEYVSLKEAAEILSVSIYQAESMLYRNPEFRYNKNCLPIIYKLKNRTRYFKKSDIEKIISYFKEYTAINETYDKIIKEKLEKIKEIEKKYQFSYKKYVHYYLRKKLL